MSKREPESLVFLFSENFKNKKNGKVYKTIPNVFINCTNKNKGEKMQMYLDDKGFYVREEKEFFEKFDVTNENSEVAK